MIELVQFAAFIGYLLNIMFVMFENPSKFPELFTPFTVKHVYTKYTNKRKYSIYVYTVNYTKRGE
jgi:hypothetical protein